MGRGGGGAGRSVAGGTGRGKKAPGGEVHSPMVNEAPPAVNTEAFRTNESTKRSRGGGAQRVRGLKARRGQ